MTNLEWFNEIGMIAENEVWTKTPDLKGQIGVNLVIALRDDDLRNILKKVLAGFWKNTKNLSN